MSKKFGKDLIWKLQRIQFKLDDMENCEDEEEMIHIAMELSADIECMKESIEEKYRLAQH